MPPDLWSLYSLMLKSRLYEEAIAKLWNDGFISGEMHLGTGEEAIIAGVVAHLREGDAMALDHRGTAALLMRGVDPVLSCANCWAARMGYAAAWAGTCTCFLKNIWLPLRGLSAQTAGRSRLCVISPLFTPGCDCSCLFRRWSNEPGDVDGVNEPGFGLEFTGIVCLQGRWLGHHHTIRRRTGGDLMERVRGLGVPAVDVDGRDVSPVWEAANSAIEFARSGHGPTFLHARCVHFEGHFLGFQLIGMMRNPLREMPKIAIPLTKSFLRPGGARLSERLAGLKTVITAVLETLRDPRRNPANDPIRHTRITLQSDPVRLQALEDQAAIEIKTTLESVLAGVTS